jgi:hypothetical protein
MEQKISPTWGYKPDGSAQIFDLKEGEKLPDGWADRPEPWNHPNTAHLHSRPVKKSWEEQHEAEPKKRSRPRKSQEADEQLGAELASELRDE